MAVLSKSTESALSLIAAVEGVAVVFGSMDGLVVHPNVVSADLIAHFVVSQTDG